MFCWLDKRFKTTIVASIQIVPELCYTLSKLSSFNFQLALEQGKLKLPLHRGSLYYLSPIVFGFPSIVELKNKPKPQVRKRHKSGEKMWKTLKVAGVLKKYELIWIAVCALCKSGHLQSKLDDEVQDMTANVHLTGKLSLIKQIEYNTSSGELFIKQRMYVGAGMDKHLTLCRHATHANPHLLTMTCLLWLCRKSVRLPPASAPWKEKSLILGWSGQKCEPTPPQWAWAHWGELPKLQYCTRGQDSSQIQTMEMYFLDITSS